MIEHNIIIKEPSKNLRALGRNALNGKWKISIIAICIYLIVLEFPPIVFDAIFGTSVGSMVTSNGYTYGMDAETYAQFINDLPDYCPLSGIYVILVTGALTLGVSLFFLATFRRHDVHSTDIFLGFEKFGKALGLYIFQAIFIALWTCLFIIPGIIASIRYSQAFFILADDPSKGIRQCMNESKAMMKGNKSKYFWLYLSFIGWAFLCAIPSGIVESIGPTVSGNEFVVSIFSIIGGLCLAPVIVYGYSTFAGFYEILSGHLIKETKPVPVTEEEAQAAFAEIQTDAAVPVEKNADEITEKTDDAAETEDKLPETEDKMTETEDKLTEPAEEKPEDTETPSEIKSEEENKPDEQ